jgi:hypothetical protein
MLISFLINVFITLYVCQVILVFLLFVLNEDNFRTKKNFLCNQFIPFYFVIGFIKFTIENYRRLK